MRIVLTIAMALLCGALAGCQSSSPRGGSIAKDEGFKVVVPGTDTEIKQGEVQTVAVTVERGESFKRDVKLEVSPSKGLSIDPSTMTVRASARPDVQLRVTAAKNAAIGDYRIRVKATPDSGEATTVEFVVKVVAP